MPQSQPQSTSAYALQSLLVLLALAFPVRAVEPPITALTFTPDGNSVVATSQVGIHVFHWPDLKPVKTIPCESANLHCLAFRPDGNQLAVGGGDPGEQGLLEFFSWPDGKSIRTVARHADSVTAIVWPDVTRCYSTSLDREIQITTSNADDKTQTLRGHSRAVRSLCLIPEHGLLASAGDDQSVRIWDTKDNQLIRSLNQHTRPIHDLALKPSADALPMLASAAADRTIRFWQPTIGRMVRYVRLSAEPLDVAWTHDGSKIVASCDDGRVHFVDPVEVTVTHVLPGVEGWAYAIAIHPTDGHVVVAGSNGKLHRIDADDFTDSP